MDFRSIAVPATDALHRALRPLYVPIGTHTRQVSQVSVPTPSWSDWSFAAALALVSGIAAEAAIAKDWEQEMPPVSRVLEVAEQQTWFAAGKEEAQVALIGTLQGLRRIMVDSTGIRDIERMPDDMRRQTIEYLWAELAVTRQLLAGMAKSNGQRARICRNPNSDDRRIFRMTAEECLLEKIYFHSGSYERSYKVHVDVWPLLFPQEVASHYIEQARSKALTTPVIDDVAGFRAREARLPAGVPFPTRDQCAAWSSHSAGEALCRLVAVCMEPTPDASTPDRALYGPYQTLVQAATAAWPLVRAIPWYQREHKEWGMMLLKSPGSAGEYYVVRPEMSRDADMVTYADYLRGLRNAASVSCLDLSKWSMVALAHTHPVTSPGFSVNDLLQAVQNLGYPSLIEKELGHSVKVNSEATLLYRWWADAVLSFTPRHADVAVFDGLTAKYDATMWDEILRYFDPEVGKLKERIVELR